MNPKQEIERALMSGAAEVAGLRSRVAELERKRSATEIREMLHAMQAGELTVSRGIELVDMWLAGNYRDDMLPPVRDGLGEDEAPWDRIDSLTQQLDAARNCERVWETSMMGAVGEDGPGDVVKAIDSIKQQRDEFEEQRDAAWAEIRRIRVAIGADMEESTADEAERVKQQSDELLSELKQVEALSEQRLAQRDELLAALEDMMEYAGIIEERCDSAATNRARRIIAKEKGAKHERPT